MSDMRIVTPKAPGSVDRVARNQYRQVAGTPEGAFFGADYLHSLAREGRIFYASPGAALNTVITGVATSFSATTPDFTLEVPAGTTCMPLRVQLTQAGTVAGGAISVIIGIQGAVERSSAGTVFPNILSSRTDGLGVTRACTPYTAPTVATDTIGVRVYAGLVNANVATGVATDNVDYQPILTGEPLYLVGPAALKIYTWATATAPSWLHEMAWAEIPSTDLTN
ncbi:MAG: hypothetical protein ACRESF_25670 [Pseudomonas sp.]